MDIIERVMSEDPGMTLDQVRSMRFTADHCGMYPRNEQIARMKRLGMMFSCAAKELNATHGYAIGKIYGEQYANRVGPIRSMLEGGLMVGNEGSGDGMDDVNPTAFSRFFPYITRKRSDGAVLSKDYFTIPQDQIPSVYPFMVVMGGKTTVLREEYAREIGLPAVGPQLKFSWEDTYPAP
jgi:predicted amidohydrolase YtcJ